TLRVSLTADPVEEVRVAFEILKSLGLRERGPIMIACPSCGRDNVGVQTLAEKVEERLRGYPQHFEVAVLGCAVNGPGEAGSGALARHADESPPSTEIKKVLNLELRSYALVKKGQVRKSLPPLASAAKLLKTYSAAANQYATTGGGDEAESFARYWGTYESLGNISRLAMQKTDVWKKDVQALALGKQNKLAGEKVAVSRSVT